MRACLATIGVALAVAVAPAWAHERTTSYSTWHLDGRQALVRVVVSALDVTRLPHGATSAGVLDPRLARYLTERLQLVAGGTPCPLSDGPRALAADPSRVVYEWHVTCPTDAPPAIQSDVLFDLSPTHLHIARVTRPGTPSVERVLVAHDRTWALPVAGDAADTGTRFVDYLHLGVEHIASGWDHIAFVVALLLAGGTLGEIARIVTGFTVAHSLTLGLAVLGWVRPNATAIEALVGLSIALVAVENVWLSTGGGAVVPAAVAGALLVLAVAAGAGLGALPPAVLAGVAVFSWCYFGLLARAVRRTSLRWAIAFVFGLVHGFAFASVLIEAQLDTSRLVRALLGFNLGVEAGQLAIVCVVWPLWRVATRGRDGVRAVLVESASTAICALGVFWFVRRAYG